jgi:predicted CopG family antitoxin
MASKTISLENSAYERLKASRRGGESFSDVVNRLTPPPPKGTVRDLKKLVESGSWGKGVDWTRVKRAVANRRRSRDFRPAA